MNAKQALLARLGPKQKPVAYERKTFDLVGEDSIENFMPAPKRLVTEEYEEIAAELHKKTLEVQYTENFIKEAIEASLRLTEAVYKTTEENRAKEATINELSGKLRDLEEGAKNKLSEIQGLTDQLNKLEAYKTTAQAENTELNNQIVELRADLEAKTNEFNGLDQTYQAALNQINQLKQNIIQNNADIEEYKNRLYAANEEITKAKNNLVKLQEELNQITKAYGELKTNYDQSIKDYDMVSGSLVAVRGEKKTLQKNFNEANEALRAEQAKNADLEAKYKTTSEDRDRLRRDYDYVYGKNEKNEEENARLLEQYDEATRKINVLRTGNDLQQQRIVALEDNIKGLEDNAKIKEALVSDLRKQAKESESLRNQLVQVTTDLNNTKASFGPAVGAAVEQENRRLQRLHEKEINKLNEELQGSKRRNKTLGEKLKTADTEKQVALAQKEREFLSKYNALNDENFAKVEALNRQHAAERVNWENTLFDQEALRKAAVEGKIALEKEIKAQISEKEKLIDQLKQKNDELKDAQVALKNLKDKYGERDFLQKQIADYEEQRIELQNEIKIHKDNLSKLRKADKQLDSSPPSGFDFFGPAPARQSRTRRTNANNFFPPPSYSFPPPSYYSPPPPPPSNNFFPSPSYYSPPPPPNYNPAPPSYLPKWPGDSNKLTLEIKVAGGEGGTRAGLDSNLSPVSRPRGDIISKLPFGPYGIEIFQPERFRKMDTKQDKKKGKKQPTPYQIARSVGKSLFRNLDPLRIRKTSVGTDTTYHALERTPAMFETFGRSTKRRKVTRIY